MLTMFKHTLQVFDISFRHSALKPCAAVPFTFGVNICKHCHCHWLRVRPLSQKLHSFTKFSRQAFREHARSFPIAGSFRFSSVSDDNPSPKRTRPETKTNFSDGPSLQHFIANSTSSATETWTDEETATVPYLTKDSFDGNQRKGCY